MPDKQRDWKFEFLRIVAMLLIVTTHFFADDNWAVHNNPAQTGTWAGATHNALSFLGQVGVTLFVLISAYFVATKTTSPIKRLWKLWMQIFLYSAPIFLLFLLVKWNHTIPEHYLAGVTVKSGLVSFLPITEIAYWFISAYFIMTAFSPFINKLMDHLTSAQSWILTVMIIWVTMIWRILNAQSQYYTDFGYLISIYLIGANIRRYPERLPRIHWYSALICTVISFGLCVVGTHALGRQNSITAILGNPPTNLLTAGPGASPILAVISGAVIFIWVAQIHTRNRVDTVWSRLIIALAPSTLGIYLIHENFLIKPLLWDTVFKNPEPMGLFAKLIFSVAAITVVFLTLMLVSYIYDLLIVNPIIRGVSRIHLSDKTTGRHIGIGDHTARNNPTE